MSINELQLTAFFSAKLHLYVKAVVLIGKTCKPQPELGFELSSIPVLLSLLLLYLFKFILGFESGLIFFFK